MVHSKVIDYIKDHLERSVDVQKIQSGYFGDFLEINLARPAVLLDPRKDRRSTKNIRWKDGTYNLRIWVMVQIDRDYMSSMRSLEQLLEPDDAAKVGVITALNKLKADPVFQAMAGSTGGKAWRMSAPILEINSTDFGIQQSASQRINVAQIDVDVIFEIEK